MSGQGGTAGPGGAAGGGESGAGGTMPPPYVPGISRDPAGGGPVVRRSLRTALAMWWREIDGVLLFFIVVLMAMGALAVAAAAPASAVKLSDAKHHYGAMHFFIWQVMFQAVGLGVMLAASWLRRETVRRVAIVLGAVMLVALMLVPVIGTEHNGARRWLLGTSFQPSEFMKPCFAVLLAWILSWRLRDPRLPVMGIAFALTVVVAGLMMLEHDFGSAVLFAGVCFVLLMLSGLPMRQVPVIAAVAVAAIGLMYVFYANGRNRIDAFLGGGTAFDQVDIAHHTLTAGGWTGTGLWLGTRKFSLPEAHTDYILSVVGEEFGLLTCAVIVLLYLLVVMRVVRRLTAEEDVFTILAATGLVAQFGGQAFINILVNLQMFPSKGMTLPLISYGGSSTVALCLGMGFLLAITRRNPFLGRDRFARMADGAPRAPVRAAGPGAAGATAAAGRTGAAGGPGAAAAAAGADAARAVARGLRALGRAIRRSGPDARRPS